MLSLDLNLTFLAEITMNFYEINPYIRLASNSVLPPYKHIKRRVIFDYELIYIESGNFIFKYNDIVYECKKGQFIFICPNIPHSFRLGKYEVSQPHIHFDIMYDMYSESIPISFKDLPEFTNEEKSHIRKNVFNKYATTPFIKFNDSDRFFSLWKKIVSNNQTEYLVKKAALTEIISMIITDNYPELLLEKPQNSYKVALQIKDYIDAGQGLNSSLNDFEKQFSYSKYYLEREFKKNYGISLILYRNNKRMEFAAKFLKENSVTNVVEILHFSSIYSFSRTFKKHFGISPTEYKNNKF